MAYVLLIIIYIAFIGLGIPDSLLGTAWPAIYLDFALPISYASFISVIISLGTILSSILSARVISRFGTNKVTAFSTAMTAAALIGFSCSGSLLLLCICAIPLGLGAGAIDTALNNYVSLHYSATHMSFLHCFYGIGVSVSPYVLSLVIDGPYGWRGGYRIAALIQIAITFLLFVTLPIWKRVHGRNDGAMVQETKALTFSEIANIPGVKGMWCLFLTSCAIEYTCGGWGSAFLVEYRHMTAEQAARILMFYYIGMAVGRFLSGVVAAWLDSWRIIQLGQVILGMAIIFLFLSGDSYLAAIGFLMAGLGNGPLFPNFNYLTPQNFGADVSQSVMGTQMAASYIGIMLAPAVCGMLGQFADMGIFPVYVLFFYVVLMVSSWKVRHVLA